MKKNVFPLFLSFILSVSCISLAPDGNDGFYVPLSSRIAVRSGSVMEPSDTCFVTQKMAELFISSQKENPKIVSVEPYEMDGVVCLYVINLEKGYRVVSADTRIQPILAECEEGKLSLKEIDNPGVKIWLEDTADRIRVLKKYNLAVKEDYSDLWSPYKIQDDSFVKTRVMTRDSSFFDEDYIWIRTVETSSQTLYSHANQPALMTTKWGQGDPWNEKMPNYITNNRCLTGCAAVAVSQVLRYFNKKGYYPTALYHSVSVSSTTQHNHFYLVNGNLLCFVFLTTILSRSNYTSSSSRWSQMPDTYLGSHTNYVSRLMLDIGNRIDVHYSDFLSFVEPDTLDHYSIPNLPQCGVSSSYAPFNFSLVETDINAKKPVIVSAYSDSTQTGLAGGHIWVIDGCRDFSQYYITTETYYYIPSEDYYSYSNVVDVYTDDEMMSINPNVYNGMQNVSYSTHTIKDLHMNWGWDGVGDGYYDMLSSNDWLCPSGNTTLNYLYKRRMHYNISTSQLY